MKSVIPAALALAGLSAGEASAAPEYRDDRSNAVAVVESLYNAVNRREYARAWDYFGPEKPAASFEAFVEGYETTRHVELATGAVSKEGAAGSVYFSVPIAILATSDDGSEQVFAGCYTLRAIVAAIQDPPFRPITIENGALAPSSAGLEQAVPARCGDGPKAAPN